jgi:3-phosphoshikimate 1-carboxyvinyltransferase
VTAVEVLPGGPVRARFRAPGSKSVTNRLLVIAALAPGESVLENPLDSDDSQAMRRIVTGLGAVVLVEDGGWRVCGTGGALRVPAEPLDAGLSGTTMRFGTALAALAPGPVTLTGLPPLLRRPIGPLTSALRALGVHADDQDGYPPVVLDGEGIEGGQVRVDVTASSQFASALLLVAPYARRDVTVVAEGRSAAAYVELTAAAAGEWGAEIEALPGPAWRVTAGRGYRPRTVAVAADTSSAAHLYALAAATGGAVTVENAGTGGGQPDAALPEVLAMMGAAVTRQGDAVTVHGPGTLRPVDVDLGAMPDQVTTVAALAALAPGTSRIGGVGVARTHETDRLAALAAELGRLGVDVEQQPDGLTVHGGTAHGPARLATHDDHRLAMAFASVAARVPGVVVEDAGCVAKTYPAFWADLEAAGVAWRAVS